MKPSINLRYKSLLLTCLLILSVSAVAPAQITKIEYISGKINQKRINDDDATGVQRLMRKPDESLADAKVQGNER